MTALAAPCTLPTPLPAASSRLFCFFRRTSSVPFLPLRRSTRVCVCRVPPFFFPVRASPQSSLAPRVPPFPTAIVDPPSAPFSFAFRDDVRFFRTSIPLCTLSATSPSLRDPFLLRRPPPPPRGAALPVRSLPLLLPLSLLSALFPPRSPLRRSRCIEIVSRWLEDAGFQRTPALSVRVSPSPCKSAPAPNPRPQPPPPSPIRTDVRFRKVRHGIACGIACGIVHRIVH